MGDDVEMLLAKLYTQSGYDLELAQRGIVYIDEIDKVSVHIFQITLRNHTLSSDVNWKDIQEVDWPFYVSRCFW